MNIFEIVLVKLVLRMEFHNPLSRNAPYAMTPPSIRFLLTIRLDTEFRIRSFHRHQKRRNARPLSLPL